MTAPNPQPRNPKAQPPVGGHRVARPTGTASTGPTTNVPGDVSSDDVQAAFKVALTSSDDRPLDALILQHLLVEAVTPRGLMALACGLIDPLRGTITHWDSKRLTAYTRPSTAEHIAALLQHAAARGPRVSAPRDAPAELRRSGLPALAATDLVFYRRPVDTFDAEGFLVARQVRPLTNRRFAALFARIQLLAPTAGERLTPHQLRQFGGKRVALIAGPAVARLHLGLDHLDHEADGEDLQKLTVLKRALYGRRAGVHDTPTQDPRRG
jgi:hypothetical protein